MTSPVNRYDKSNCPTCAGSPPEGFSCLTCLSYAWTEDDATLGHLADVRLGNTDDLDAAWDSLMESAADASYLLAAKGVSPYVISQLFRIAIDSVKP